MEWQPIKTAPKDGTCILVFDDNPEIWPMSAGVHVAYWGKDLSGTECWLVSHKGRMCYEGFYKVGELDEAASVDPVYWMPLPNLPEQ